MADDASDQDGGLDAHTHLDQGRRAPKIGVVLGAGSARGWTHVGVLRELEALGVPIHAICGCSSGALVAASYAAGRLGVLENLAEKMTTVRLLRFFDLSLSRGGLIEGRWIVNFLRDNVGDSEIESLPLPFAAVATEYRTGREVWLNSGSLIDAVRASIALPGFLTPIELKGRILLDGAVVNPLPVSLCRSLGADIVIAVNLEAELAPPPQQIPTPPAGEDRRWGSWFSRWSGPKAPAPVATKMPSYPEVVSDAVFTMQGLITRVRLATDPADIVITPRFGDAGILDFQKARELIGYGVEAVHARRPELERLVAMRAGSSVST